MARAYYKFSEDSKEIMWKDLSEDGQVISSGSIDLDSLEVQSFLSKGNPIILIQIEEPTDESESIIPGGIYPIVYNEDGTFTQTL